MAPALTTISNTRAELDTAPAPAFRGDIDGIRALAILLVVAFHSRIPGFGGGFVGVDVFFVISGYLITRNLLAETHRNGKVRLLEFWARRIRRLVPALALMLVVVLGLALVAYASLEWQTVAEEARAAALYVSNFYFANQPTGYFGADLDQSLFLHTWSLGVEEQFYLLWPLMFSGACMLSGRRPTARRPILIIGLTVVLVSSLAWSVVLTRDGSSMAFFGLPSRAWEFAAAGLLATATIPQSLRRLVPQLVAGTVGLVLIAIAAVALSDQTPYPGTRALLPVIGAILLIVAGENPSDGTSNPLSRALALSPLQRIGRVSYSWYLWHWPLILLAVAWLDRDTTLVRSTAALGSLGIATAAHHLIENPLRFSQQLVGSKPRTYLLGGAITATILLTTVGITQLAEAEITGDDLLAMVDAAREETVDYDCRNERKSASGVEYCEEGDPNGSQTIFLVGDSHAGQWKAALAEAAEREGVRLLTRWNGGCPAIPIAKLPLLVEPGECDAFRAGNASLIRELEPDAAIVSHSVAYGRIILDDTGRATEDPAVVYATWSDAYRSYLEDLRTNDVGIGVVIPSPSHFPDPLGCIIENRSVDECAASRDWALNRAGSGELREAEADARSDIGDIATFDVIDDLCDDSVCVVMIDGIIAYTDFSHLTEAYTLRQVPALRELIRSVLPTRS